MTYQKNAPKEDKKKPQEQEPVQTPREHQVDSSEDKDQDRFVYRD